MASYSSFGCTEGRFVERVCGGEGEETGSGACEGFEEKEVGGRKIGVCQETRTPVTFFPFSPHYGHSLPPIPHRISLRILPNRLHSPLPLVLIAASSST